VILHVKLIAIFAVHVHTSQQCMTACLAQELGPLLSPSLHKSSAVVTPLVFAFCLLVLAYFAANWA